LRFTASPQRKNRPEKQAADFSTGQLLVEGATPGNRLRSLATFGFVAVPAGQLAGALSLIAHRFQGVTLL